MEQFIYNLLIQYIMMYYKGALVFSITICCLNLIAGKLCVFFKAKNTAILFFFAIYVYAVLAVTILSRAGTYISEVNLCHIVLPNAHLFVFPLSSAPQFF